MTATQREAPADRAACCDLLDELEDCRLENMENTAGQMLGKAIDWIQGERASQSARDVLIEVRDWDCLGGSVQEHYDELHGNGAYDKALAEFVCAALAGMSLTDERIKELGGRAFPSSPHEMLE